MAAQMAGTPQPHVLSSGRLVVRLVRPGPRGLGQPGRRGRATGRGGRAFLRGGRSVLPALAVLAVFCLVDWVLVEDLGFWGGTGTDPNSMLPLLLLAVGGHLAEVRLPARSGPPGPWPCR